MNYKFKKIIIHNFLSFGDATIELEDRGYCLIKGKNHNPLDKALSNGSGKCFGSGTKVRMWDGSVKNIEDIKVNDIVMGDDSSPRIVTETHSGVDQLYKVHLNRGCDYDYICNGNHIMCLYKTLSHISKKGYERYKGEPYVEISVNDYLNSTPTFKRAYCHKINPCLNFYKVNNNLPIDPYFLGLWLGDGSSSNLAITTTDDEIRDYIYNVAKNFNLGVRVVNKKETKAKTYFITSHSSKGKNILLKEFKNLNLIDNKHIPEIYLHSSVEDRLKLLAGLLDTDGSLRGKSKYICGNSTYQSYYSYSISLKVGQLSEDVINLCQSLGFRVTLGTKTVLNLKRGIGEYHRINIQGEIHNIPVILDRKKIKDRVVTKQRVHRDCLHQTIEPLTLGNYYGIGVTGNGKFLLANGLVVHNSSIISAISYCLTGETIQGIKSHIENDFVSGGCFVSLYLSVDKDNYVITRYKNHEKFKTDLKIIKNDTDISGKGIKESSIVLAQHLPELNSKLLSSVILLGQGLPNSFTKNSPSGRKELLEELTGSDFMIQDIKNRISTRLDVLNNEKRKIEDETLSLTTQNKVYNDNLIKLNEKKNTYSSVDYSGLIEDLEYKVHILEGNLNTQSELVLNYEKTNQEIYDQQLNLNQHKQQEITNTQNKYNGRIESLKNDYMESSNSLKSITQELNKLYSIKDTCPTCNQKIPNVFKPDTTKLEQEQQRYREIVKFNEESYSTLQAQLNEELNAINDTFKDKEVELNSSKLSTQQSLSNAKRERDELNAELNKANLELANYQTEKNNLLKNLQSINGEISLLEMEINETNNKLLYNNKELENVNMHLETLNKINTLVKRDFRGYLLLNIIRYIQNKAQEYCQYIFNSNNLKVVLDGNDIDILFLDKPFESLSGGEKQKIDVIIQFAIRDMMNTYLDFKSNILFLDEITDNLDTVGCNGLFNLISKTLIDLSSIFIISHHEDELILPIDDEILVEKNEKGISSVR